jgi:MFS family permease
MLHRISPKSRTDTVTSSPTTEIKKIYIFGFFSMFLVIIPVIIPYFVSIGLSMEEIFQLQAIFGATVAILEVPSGYLCDLWGRKKTIILGAFIAAIGDTYLVVSSSFWDLAIFELLSAIGLSLISGSDLSILYDLIKESKNEQRSTYTNAMANHQLTKVIGESVASLLGGALALISLSTVAIAHAFGGWISFFVALTLKEPKFNKMDRRDHSGNFRKILGHIFRNNRLLTLTFLNLVIWGLSSFIAVWMYQKHWSDGGIHIGYFGLLWATYNLSVGVAGRFVHPLENKFGATPLLVALGLLPIAGYFGMGWFVGWAGVVFGLLINIGRGITQVILKDALNWRVPSEFRATVNSMASLCFRGGFVIIGPGVGYLIDHDGLANTFGYVGWGFTAAFIVALLPLIYEVRKANLKEIPH